MCAVHGTIQTGSKHDWSLQWLLYNIFPMVPWWSTGKNVTWALCSSYFFFDMLLWFTDLNHYRGLIYLIPLCVQKISLPAGLLVFWRNCISCFLKKKKKKEIEKGKPSQLQSHELRLCKDNSHSLSLSVCVGNKALSKPFRYPQALKYHLVYFVDW